MKDAIAVENLSKHFELGALQHETMLRERLIRLLRPSFHAKPVDILWALRDVSFRVGQGEVVGIIGPNGAGKSTLLKILSKITFPSSGRVRVSGRVASLLEVGTGFHEELTGRENIFLNGSILGMKGKEVVSKLDAIVEFAGVERFVDTPIKRYSSGMRLRLGFAVAAHLDPDVLIVDEVLAVGDAGFQKKCLDAMEDLRSGGRTVLFVSHNMAAVENLCTRCIWIDNGQVRQDGSTRQVIEAYMATFADSQQSAADLSTVDSRRGTGEIRYTSVEFLSQAGTPLQFVRSGDAITLRFHFHASKPIPYPCFGFKLFTELGTLITATGTWHHAMDFPVVPAGDGFIDVEIDALNLLSARYVFSLFLTGAGSQVYDVLENSVRLDVESANIYNSGRPIDSSSGITFFPQRWRLHGPPDDKTGPLGGPALGVAQTRERS
jgi:lipopolysaccharide transport system ATP-binding protein